MHFRSDGFVTGGTWCVDHNLVIPSWPDEESATKIHSSMLQGGGSACNFAVGMRQLAPEIEVATIGLIGQDNEGRLLRSITRRYSIDDRQLQDAQEGVATHKTLAFTALDNGRRTHVFSAEASDFLTPDHFQFEAFTGRTLHLGLPGTHALLDKPWGGEVNGWVAILKKAQAAGLQTNLELMSIDEERIRELVHPCLPYLDYLVVNDVEILALAHMTREKAQGKDMGSGIIQRQEDTIEARLHYLEKAMRAVLRMGTLLLLTVHFPGGALAIDAQGKYYFHPSVNVPQEMILGTNGAGDAFTSGFFCALHRGLDVREALMLAHAAAAASLRHVGTTDSIENVEMCMQLAHQWGWR